jgi:ABC-type maltose transport system permease subunit
MNTLIRAFVILLVVVTLLLGLAWSRAEMLFKGQASSVDMILLALGIAFLLPIFTLLGRIVYLNAVLGKAAQQAGEEN